MAINQTHWLQKLLLCSSLIFASAEAKAQITPDNTLGTESSRITANTLINGAIGDKIEAGTQRGSNLFHSFSQFNINDGQRVYFANPSGVVNILTRVTGGNASNILGTLGVDGAANLFLMNPNGILFGKNASLDVRGSFVGTTANAIQFGNQGIFSATNPFSPALLTIQPSALLFNQINKNAAIQNTSVAPAGIDPAGFRAFGLRVPDGKSLVLVGGNVSMDSGELNAYGGRVELGGLASVGSVNLLFNDNNLSLGFPENVARASVLLTNQARVYVEAAGEGNIAVHAQDVEILGGSLLSAGTGQGLGTGGTQAGDITVDAIGIIKLAETGSQISNSVQSQAMGNAGNITLKTGSLEVTDGAEISANTSGKGDAGSINIYARNSIFLNDGTGDSYIFNNVSSGGVGNTGGINITTGSLSVTNGAQIQSRVLGQGNSGNISIVARDTITFDGKDSDNFSSGIFSDVESNGKGNSGGIDITGGSIFIKNGAFFSSSTYDEGDSGKISITARDTVALSGQGISSIQNNVGTGGVGNSQGININTGSLFLSDKAVISSNVDGRGNSSGVNIVADDLVSLDDVGELSGAGQPGTLILSRVNDKAEGNSGDINIKTGSLRASNSQITTSTWSKGNSGNVIIEARSEIALLRSTDIFTEVTCACETESGQGGDGQGGDIQIRTGSLILDNGSNLRADTEAKGNAGNIIINADSIIFSGSSPDFTSGAFSQVEPEGVGRGGDIIINTDNLSLSGDHEINTRTQGLGSAGNIFINADSISLTGSDVRIISGASQEQRLPGTSGNGGDININTNSLLVTDGAKLSANTETKDAAGNININASQLTLDKKSSITSDSDTDANGGNINLQLSDLLLLRHGSQISTTAGTTQAGGNGGNININTRFIVADKRENSDISANAFSGKGGNVNIRAQGIFGIEARAKQSPLSSDITASSETGVQGQISISQPDIEPAQGLIELPEEVVDASNQIGQICPRGLAAKRPLGQFTITGRGSLPPNPLQPMTGSTSTLQLATLEQAPSVKQPNIISSPVPTSTIVEAQAWVKDASGEILLVERAPDVTHSKRAFTLVCPSSSL